MALHWAVREPTSHGAHYRSIARRGDSLFAIGITGSVTAHVRKRRYAEQSTVREEDLR
ncbi:hypothetical protein SAMCFNEI73_Ch1143 [Sinorhizobium americanum]|uniref:Uncharacterized protein n=1 Tax=Sinorhizobium americanum TaxID=194963 RepID=A0A1L3LK45_9HYPH|nr:hypothetical protein SAMCCGM7_Ch1134 [Sinorhizobium americanum CCGM7]APG90458.1 hypothetical protein SAMCFNEI73_Ch1143 [Sinorhizobium americanum]